MLGDAPRARSGWDENLDAPTGVIRDNVWGDIGVSPAAMALIDTPQYQRMRNIRQLGFVDLVYPGAHNTRFEHPIGVYHVCAMALDQFKLKGLTVDPEEARVVLAATLLHDIGHFPFSHTIEELRHPDLPSHEILGAQLICSSPIASILETDWRLDPNRVAEAIVPTSAESANSLAHQLISGTLDMDKLDYLVRDSRACGVPYGETDVQRLLASLWIVQSNATAPSLALLESGIGPLQALIFAKQTMFHNVYWHHAVRAATRMFVRAVEESLVSQAISPAELVVDDDFTLLYRLRSRITHGSCGDELLRRLGERRLPKRVLTVGPDDPVFSVIERTGSAFLQRRELELRLNDALRSHATIPIPDGAILVDVPHTKTPDEVLPVYTHSRSSSRAGQLASWDEVSGLDRQTLLRISGTARRAQIFALDPAIADFAKQEVDCLRETVMAFGQEHSV